LPRRINDDLDDSDYDSNDEESDNINMNSSGRKIKLEINSYHKKLFLVLQNNKSKHKPSKFLTPQN
jgi:hypothetical protein